MNQKIIALLSAAALCAGMTACGSSASTSSGTPVSSGSDASASAPVSTPITIISREDGSGTRGAFIELFGVEQKDADGNKVDHTTELAEITNSTSVMMTTVAGNVNAIGYCSLGSLNDSVKALTISGVEATADNIKSGDYTISRPFNIATKADISDLAADFIGYIMSADGQAIIEEEGYIAVAEGEAYTPSGLTGKITVAGSSSVTPVMEVLKEGYTALNPEVTIEVQQSDSSTGVTSAIEGTCDIGMASRDLKDSETEQGVSSTTIAMDGIAVIVNLGNAVSDLTPEQVCSIYTGEITDWSAL